MKKLVYSILAAAAVLSAASCQRETQMAREQGGLVDVTFQVGLQGLQTKAFSDGASATTLDVYVYSARTDGDVLLPNLTQQKENAFQNLTAQVTMKLVRGENYKIVFWAHAPQSPYTVDPDKATITVSDAGATPAPAANDELRDAFLGKFEGAVTTAVSASVALTRPFAQLNVLTTDADWDASIANGITFAGSSMKLTAPSEMNLLTGEVSKEVAMEFAMAPITEAVNIPQYETGYKWIAMNYILASDTKALIGEANKPFTFAVYREGQADLLFEQNLATIPVQRNYRTVIVGDVFCVDGSFTVSIVPDYDGVLTPADNNQQTTPVIAVDGNFDEWTNVTAIAGTGAIKAMKVLFNDEKYFFYLEADKTKLNTDTSHDYANYITLHFDDGDLNGNIVSSFWNQSGLDEVIQLWLMQQGVPNLITWGVDGFDHKEAVDGDVAKFEFCINRTAGSVFAGQHLLFAASVDGLYVDGSDWKGSSDIIGFAPASDQDMADVGPTPVTPATNTPVEATITASDVTVEVGKSVQINATTNSTAPLTYKPFDTNLISVDANGVVTGLKICETEVTISVAAVEGKFTAAEKTIKVTVYMPPEEPITIDGNMYDWDSFTLMNGTTTSRIRSWKFTSSNDNLYFFFVLRENKMRTAYNLILGFDFNDTGAYTDNNNMKNCEILLSMQPFTNVDAGTPVCVNGDVSTATVNGVSVTGIKAYGYDPDPAATGDSADYHLEISVPKSVLTGLPASGDVNVAGSYEYYWTGFQVLAL